MNSPAEGWTRCGTVSDSPADVDTTDPNEPTWGTAWEPLTPRGVAAFAGASLGRLLLVQLIVALFAAATVGWFLKTGWFPVVREAIQAMPDEGSLRYGRLAWNGKNPQQLAQNRFLSIGVDLYHSMQLGREAHLQVEFGQTDFRIGALPGYDVFDYSPDSNYAFNRTALEPWWGAWQPWIFVGALACVVAGLMISWTLLATIYFLPVRVLSFLENRDLDLRQSWLLSGAAMMPGALFMIAGIAAYTLGLIDLIRLAAVFGLHFLVGWIYLVISPFFCPRHPAAAKKEKGNPFAASK
ncbi:MAG TPA: hypothetical protein VFB72_19095 [Verrucomicrobiae bacterium]|nr:hypothetical protein [Verrucomicrobiae bacterium]